MIIHKLRKFYPKRWPKRWNRPASALSRLLRPILQEWMIRKRAKILNAPRLQNSIPVVCIGNLVVGGSGKSPLLGSVAIALKRAGFKPGIISGGYGGDLSNLPVEVESDTLPNNVGDEPIMLRQQTNCPVVACRDRSRAIERLSFHHDIDVILADDGLQNALLWRDFSVVVFNQSQGIGNGLELPFGPLREPLAVLDQMDAIVVRETVFPDKTSHVIRFETQTKVFRSECYMSYVYCADAPDVRYPLKYLATMDSFDAVAGISSPRQFFEGLSRAGISFREHVFCDHHRYSSADLEGKSLIITTEKDAVKLIHLIDQPFWVVALESTQPEFEEWLIDLLTDWSRK